jgi:hypothetical protein
MAGLAGMVMVAVAAVMHPTVVLVLLLRLVLLAHIRVPMVMHPAVVVVLVILETDLKIQVIKAAVAAVPVGTC